jgi:hypothetical protein
LVCIVIRYKEVGTRHPSVHSLFSPDALTAVAPMLQGVVIQVSKQSVAQIAASGSRERLIKFLSDQGSRMNLKT